MAMAAVTPGALGLSDVAGRLMRVALVGLGEAFKEEFWRVTAHGELIGNGHFGLRLRWPVWSFGCWMALASPSCCAAAAPAWPCALAQRRRGR
ncbi:unnamed protein product [Durusdinium trenchii]|uniref:Uncharacterized protein n=1 Tax=Durusdinium trenchii TaxID=1381693 RepID=A0ABP0QP23_9DINO